MQRMWRARSQDTYNMEYGYSCMGYEISGALGVKLAIGDGHEVYAMVGDGSFIMLHSELLTAVQEHKKINICVFDNASFGCINNLQVGQGNQSLCTELRYRNPETGRHDGSFISVDFAAIGRAYGAQAYTIRTLDELEKAMEEARGGASAPSKPAERRPTARHGRTTWSTSATRGSTDPKFAGRPAARGRPESGGEFP